jgi:hypothetical protein
MVTSPMAKVGIFVSYARRDGADLALLLQNDLTAAGFDAWLDKQRIGGGASWTVEIEEAIDHAQVVLALLTPGSYTSEICRAEQLRSLRKGKCVIPLLAAPGSDIPLFLEPKNFRDFTQKQAYAGSFQSLLRDIEGRNGVGLLPTYRTTQTSYITAPPTVAKYITRPESIRALRDRLFEEDGRPAIALTALEGMGGIGKTVLAQALLRDEAVQQAFPDGLVWITVGREPTRDVNTKLREITRVLGGESDEAVGTETMYRTTIASKAALFIIDDIWRTSEYKWHFANQGAMSCNRPPPLRPSGRSGFLTTHRLSSTQRLSFNRHDSSSTMLAPRLNMAGYDRGDYIKVDFEGIQQGFLASASWTQAVPK